MTTTPSEPSNSASRFAPLSLATAPVAWALLYASGRLTDTTFTDLASNVMIALLVLSAVVTIAGLVLAVRALRARTPNRLLALLGALLNTGTLLVLMFVAVVAVFLSA